MNSVLIFLSFLLSIVICHSPSSVHTRPINRVSRPSKYVSIAEEQYRIGQEKLAAVDPHTPQQILTALTGEIGSIAVSYVTFAETNNTHVWWGNTPSDLIFNSTGTSYSWADPQNSHKIRTSHNVLITGLQPKQTIYYQVGDSSNPSTGMSIVYQFIVPPNGPEIVNMVVYGDMGVINSQAIQYVIDEVRAGTVDIVLHVGDFAYDLHTEQGSYGDIFMNEIMPMSTTVPYMGCEGNHEGKYNSSHYTHRFNAYLQTAKNSNSDTNWWYSWDYTSGGALVHMVSFDTEVYYDYVDNFTAPDLHISRRRQYEWLDEDLTAAKQRGADWIIVYGHRPLYCSNTDDLHDCFSDTQILRQGWNFTDWGVEKLFLKHNVDLYLSAHEHSYERIFPVYQGEVDINIDLRTSNHTYIKPNFPTYIITGSAGCQEYFDYFDSVVYGKWSVVRSVSYGYGYLQIHNSTHLYWEQLIDEGKQGIDYLWIEK